MRFVKLQLLPLFVSYMLSLFISGICVLNLQFGYFSFGGSTVICVFEKVGIFIVRMFEIYFVGHGVYYS